MHLNLGIPNRDIKNAKNTIQSVVYCYFVLFIIRKMKSILLIWIFFLLQFGLSSAILFTPDNAVCLSQGNLGTKKKYEGEYRTTFVDPLNLNSSVDLGKKNPLRLITFVFCFHTALWKL
jgi:hypothetical protein